MSNIRLAFFILLQIMKSCGQVWATVLSSTDKNTFDRGSVGNVSYVWADPSQKTQR
jgi:hypothetical protein